MRRLYAHIQKRKSLASKPNYHNWYNNNKNYHIHISAMIWFSYNAVFKEKRGYKRILFLQWYHLAKNLVDMTGENAYTRVLTTYNSRGEELWMFRIESVKTYSMQNCVIYYYMIHIYVAFTFIYLFNLASINFTLLGFHRLQCPFCQMKFILLSKFIAAYSTS